MGRTHTAPTRTVVSLSLLRPGLVPHPCANASRLSYAFWDAEQTRPAGAWPCLCRELWLCFGALAVSSGEHNMTTPDN